MTVTMTQMMSTTGFTPPAMELADIIVIFKTALGEEDGYSKQHNRWIFLNLIILSELFIKVPFIKLYATESLKWSKSKQCSHPTINCKVAHSDVYAAGKCWEWGRG
jgi:L-asparagine transporter-like permease